MIKGEGVIRVIWRGVSPLFEINYELGRQESNPEPSDPESDVLPIAPRPKSLVSANILRAYWLVSALFCNQRWIMSSFPGFWKGHCQAQMFRSYYEAICKAEGFYS
jgi:hypothetical protein